MTSPHIPAEEQADGIPDLTSENAPAGLMLRPLIEEEIRLFGEFRDALRGQRAVLGDRNSEQIARATDLVSLQMQRLARASDQRIRRTLGLGLEPADNSPKGLSSLLRAKDDHETADLADRLHGIAVQATQDTAITHRIAEGQLEVARGVLDAIQGAASQEPLGYDPNENAGPIPGAILTRHA